MRFCLFSLCTSVALEGCILSCLSISLCIYCMYIYIYFHISLCWSFQSALPPQLLRELQSNERQTRGCFQIKICPALFLFNRTLFPSIHSTPAFSCCFIWACFPCDPTTHLTPGGHRRNASGVSSRPWKIYCILYSVEKLDTLFVEYVRVGWGLGLNRNE